LGNAYSTVIANEVKQSHSSPYACDFSISHGITKRSPRRYAPRDDGIADASSNHSRHAERSGGDTRDDLFLSFPRSSVGMHTDPGVPTENRGIKAATFSQER
jgi:hypothetical protein